MKKKMIKDVKGRLYGIDNSNRKGAQLWGKNQFNSNFPAALACYMRDKKVPCVYLRLDKKLHVEISDLPIEELFNTKLLNSELQFDFETKYEPYQQYALDDIGGIDLIIRRHGDMETTGWLRPLEVKLTVMPDDKTSKLPESEWSPELVIRPATTKYCALGIYHSCRDHRTEIRDIFQDVCGNFEHWESKHELLDKRKSLLKALNHFQDKFQSFQQPFLMQPIWKTDGKCATLAENAFDLFVWSDFALCRAFIRSLESDKKITRFSRAAARLARMLYVLSTEETANLKKIYTEMTYGLQTDKEFSIPGDQTKIYFDTPRRLQPIFPKTVVSEIILDGGEKNLSPERRFDATIFFTAEAVFDVKEAVTAVKGLGND